jgi:hypothetical protein
MQGHVDGIEAPRKGVREGGGIVLAILTLGVTAVAVGGAEPHRAVPGPALPGVPCSPSAGPEYYQFPLVPTGRVPGTGNATGVGEILFPHTPWGVALTGDGSYLYDFTIRFARLRPPRTGAYVVWVTTPTLDRVSLSGELTNPEAYSGRVAWNKFLVVVTHEPAFDPEATTWTGPVVIRGMSRSGMMHTMAGHGPFEQENCAAFGYE